MKDPEPRLCCGALSSPGATSLGFGGASGRVALWSSRLSLSVSPGSGARVGGGEVGEDGVDLMAVEAKGWSAMMHSQYQCIHRRSSEAMRRTLKCSLSGGRVGNGSMSKLRGVRDKSIRITDLCARHRIVKLPPVPSLATGCLLRVGLCSACRQAVKPACRPAF